jgi:hypothetical protein
MKHRTRQVHRSWEKEFGAMIQSEIVEIIPLSEVTEGAAVPSSLGDEKKARVLTRDLQVESP